MKYKREDYKFLEGDFLESIFKKYAKKELFRFYDGDVEKECLTGEQLEQKEKGFGEILKSFLQPQEKVVVLLKQGLEFICSMLGCFHANVVAIPLNANKIGDKAALDDMLIPILEDSGARCIITNKEISKYMQSDVAYQDIIVISAEETYREAKSMAAPRKHEPDDICILQYTSGSSARPKGAMLTHRNTWINAYIGKKYSCLNEKSVMVCWSPQFHSFGLMIGFLSPFLAGATTILFSPEKFIEEPALWFRLIDKFQATHTSGSNFAFDYCYSSVAFSEVEHCSLSSIRAIYSAGEPVRMQTIQLFMEKFRSLGLQENVFCPLYGMSEAGVVTALECGKPLYALSLDIKSLAQGKIKLAEKMEQGKFTVSCGKALDINEIICVNLNTMTICQEGEIGEIWMRGPSVASGYWRRPEETAQNFYNTVEGKEGFYRSGDLGFFYQEHIFIIGREKEVMIIHGKNYYQVDVEWTIQNHLPELTLPICVFSSDVEDEEKVFVVVETEQGKTKETQEETASKITACISEKYGITVHKILFVVPGSIPKTASGKTQRNKCRTWYQLGQLHILYEMGEEESLKETRKEKRKQEGAKKCREIKEKLKKEVLREVFQINNGKLDRAESLNELGFDSIKFIQTAKKIRDVFKIEFEPVLLFKYRTFDEISLHVKEKLEEKKEQKAGSIEGEEKKTKEFLEISEGQEIAVIGMNCNFPGGSVNPTEFFQNLIQGKDCIEKMEKGHPYLIREYQNNYGDTEEELPIWGGFVEDRASFDAAFFGISPLEAESMDPQQRKAMELTWKTIEDAGYNPTAFAGMDVGVFFGVHSNDYAQLIARNPELVDTYGAYLDTGVHMSLLPNRVSRWFDFHGPSEVFNTACSSSLTAIHHAMKSIRMGECTMAIAGGLNLLSSPLCYAAGSKAGMFSEDGHCKTFDGSADGFVRSEGYGAVLLKPYAQAVKDGDAIYGILKGSAINHDGQSSSLRAPNLNAQRELILSAFRDANVPIETITNIEMHGTGTALGDPIEFRALKEAFLELGAGKKGHFCGLSSIKTIIGHCESASGIASLIKVLLSMKAHKLPGNLHFKKQNPYIQMEDSPFYYIKESQDWKPLLDEEGKSIPLRAGISSFGIGGSNAHIIVEEYKDISYGNKKNKKVIVPFSAKSEDSLLRTIEEFYHYYRTTSEKIRLEDLAYTLQVGRCPMEYRKAFVVRSEEELICRLSEFIETPDFYYAEGRRENNKAAKEDGYVQVSHDWEAGQEVDWGSFYKEEKPHRLHLPTYEFQKKEYWIGGKKKEQTKAFKKKAPVIHPLLQKNTSDFSEQKFTSIFTNKDFFIQDYQVDQKMILPRVVSIEMARAAFLESFVSQEKKEYCLSVKDLIWCDSIEVAQDPVEVSIGLSLIQEEEAMFELFTGEEETVHVKGRIGISPVSKEVLRGIEEKKRECGNGKITGSELYQWFEQVGVHYGASFRGIKEVFLGESEAIARIQLPPKVDTTLEEYVLHPSLLDACMQLSMVFMPESQGVLMVPFQVKEVIILRRCSASMWAYIQKADQGTKASRTQEFNIDLCDMEGNVCVRFCMVQLMKVEGKGVKRQENTILFVPVWKKQKVKGNQIPLNMDQVVYILVEPERHFIDVVSEFQENKCIVLHSEEENIAERYKAYALQMFLKLQDIMKNNSNSSILLQLVVRQKGMEIVNRGLAAMLKSAQAENPKIQVQTIGIEDWKFLSEDMLKAEAVQGRTDRIQYAGGKRYILEWKKVTQTAEPEKPCWKDSGVYLITGGMGGIGLCVAKEIARKVQSPVLILTGRSGLKQEKEKELKELGQLGACVEYAAVDVSQRTKMAGLIQKIVKKYGKLNGVLHAAGVIQDNYMFKKTREELQEVMKAKVDGLFNLDLATANLPLDFILVFSSVSGCFGNAGQADYAAANAFMDQYVHYRRQLQESGKRYGKMLSISWPLWKNAGMTMDSSTKKRIAETIGMTEMPVENGMQALYKSMELEKEHVLVLHGWEDKISVYVKGKHLEEQVARRREQVEDKSLLRKSISYFKQLIASILRMPAEQLDEKKDMGEYGIDSIVMMEINARLEKHFHSLSKTLFFEYNTIEEVADYFVKNNPEKMIELTDYKKQESEKQEVHLKREEDSQTKSQEVTIMRRMRKRQLRKGIGRKEEIAVIGLAGHYPGADNLQEFWKNLCEGKDCITEIPKERWDYEEYFDAHKNKQGKTYTKWGGFLNQIEYFDPLFFHISPKEAEKIEPQERLFLQCVQETIEDAGYTKEQLSSYGYGERKGRVGVFAGAMFQEYQLYGAQMEMLGKPEGIYGTLSQVANRVSYFYNLHGPSMTIDTMCSSSLTAIHLACESINHGECSIAIAGGVNVSVHPNKYLILAQGKFASSEGKCRSFGAGGDGYVPGEGVGAMLLKPLSKAVEDGDHIYGIIKGTAVNHGGKVSGITVPNPTAQADVVKAALQDADVDAETITYVEAHGTGTALGDPIEITGLTKAFETYTNEKQFCKIGSVKTNIGHCESAAGIASITKVLLQMKYGKLVPSLYAEVENPNIDFKETPFSIQKTLEDWKPKKKKSNGEIVEIKRRAGISSFGAGGANAHIILEEYQPKKTETESETETENIILLTANTKEQLGKTAERLLYYIEEQKIGEDKLPQIAYTLQTGRSFYQERLAMIVSTVKQLTNLLQEYVSGVESEEYVKGTTRENPLISNIFDDEEMQSVKELWMEKKKYKKLLRLWVMGLEVDWSSLYKNCRIEKISLPTYPFAKERYWFPDEFKKWKQIMDERRKQQDWIHPLLHKNKSNLDEQKFSSTFYGDEFFLQDHIVNGVKVYPGAAYLEMARKACVESVSGSGETSFCLKYITWMHAMQVKEYPRTVITRLYRTEERQISFKISDERSSFCEGNAEMVELQKNRISVNMQELMKTFQNVKFTREECYKQFQKMGIVYGREHQGIQCIYKKEGQVLAKIFMNNISPGYYLHPGMLDSAMQVSVGLFEGDQLRLPYSLERLEVYGQTVDSMWAYAKIKEQSDKNIKVDIDLYDEGGSLLVKMTKLCFREIGWQGKKEETEQKQQEKGGDLKESSQTELYIDLKKKTEQYLKEVFSEASHLPVEKINEEENLGNYGIDSLMMMQMTDRLEKELGAIPKTLFFEYLTIKELAAHFLKRNKDKLEKMFAEEQKAAIPERKFTLLEDRKEKKVTQKPMPKNMEKIQSVTLQGQDRREEIAIIGLAGHYAMADNMQEFWDNLCEGKDCVTEVPKERWDYNKYFNKDKKAKGKTYMKWGGFLKDIEYFDPFFFQIPLSKAETMDPQERLFLECVEEAIEDAGYSYEGISDYQYEDDQKKVGVFVGAMYQEHQIYGVQANERGSKKIVSGMNASIANRVSYYYNFHGPCMALDTMCSSSLTAIHLACQSLHNKECGLAIAGGVNVSIHPNKYLMLAQDKFASSEGKCRAFGEGGDGYVPGEGVGAVLLKPLSKAVEDGDHIYGVIKATATNHGGRTNGFTVPNPLAQAEVVKKALELAKINPRTITYIEAHGTGTALGDPIEIKGLTRAFEQFTSEKQFCRVGSVKANIGHCESASGMASLSKVLLQFKYGKLVPSIHSETLNSNIDFSETPFLVQHKLEEWKREWIMEDGVEKELPRRAEVQAFGAGGSNTAIILEEYIETREALCTDSEEQENVIIVLSAKTKEQVMEEVRRMISFIRKSGYSDKDLKRIAYTMQTGRTAYEERLAVIVSSLQELKEKLKAFLRGEKPEGLYQTKEQGQCMLDALKRETEDVEARIFSWYEKKEYATLLTLWVNGLSVNWSVLYENQSNQKISLPTYPFAKERCWFPDILKKLNRFDTEGGQVLHPLLQSNTSTLYEEKFTTTLYGTEHFLQDHQVNGKKVLPGAAYLEMARKAYEEAEPESRGKVIKVENVRWKHALEVKDKERTLETQISLDEEQVQFVIHEDKMEFCCGYLRTEAAGTKEKVDLEQLRTQCQERVMTREECYEEYRRVGISYGESQKGILEVHQGKGMALAELYLEVQDTGYCLYPGMFDSAIQSAIGVLNDGSGTCELMLPCGIEQCMIYQGTSNHMWAHVMLSEEDAEGNTSKIHIDLYHNDGTLAVQLKNMSFRTARKKEKQQTKEYETLIFHPVWERKEVR